MNKFVQKINVSKFELPLLAILVLCTFVLRFPQLGYSHFYGDETKVLYLDKTIPAPQFLMDQRKGPVQFLAVWFMEKLTGGYSELWMRLPFAVAGFLSVFVLYLVVKKLFSYKAAFLASFLFGVNGFFVAFSRIVQYQSILILLGLTSIYFLTEYLEVQKKIFLLIASLFMSLALLSHYDAFFFLVPAIFIIIHEIQNKKIATAGIANFLIPILLIPGIFYLPYFLEGYLQANTINYLARRLSGSGFVINYSPYTISVYNPLLLSTGVLIMAFAVFFKKIDWKKSMLLLWFIVPFVIFQFIFLNPGTHIYNYLLPLIILASVELADILSSLKNDLLQGGFLFSIAFILTVTFSVSLLIYVPRFKANYPWRPVAFGRMIFDGADKSKHLFLYGFPYNRGWDQIRDYLYAQEGARNLYTNDNDTIAEYYLRELDFTPPGSNYLPQYYVHVFDDQEFKPMDYKLLLNYDLEKEFFVDNVLMAMLFKIKT